jgi:hypothetical protein
MDSEESRESGAPMAQTVERASPVAAEATQLASSFATFPTELQARTHFLRAGIAAEKVEMEEKAGTAATLNRVAKEAEAPIAALPCKQSVMEGRAVPVEKVEPEVAVRTARMEAMGGMARTLVSRTHRSSMPVT